MLPCKNMTQREPLFILVEQRVTHICIASSQNIPSMHHLISGLYIILSRLISVGVCCFVCQDRGKKCVGDEEREIPCRYLPIFV